jgi:hypothetical protein
MRAGRIVAIVIGSILALAGALVAIAATIGLVLAGGDNTIETGKQRLATVTSAITSGSAQIEGERPGGWFFDENDELALRITAEAPAGRSLFLGIGPAADVRAYLAGVAYDEIDDLSFRPFSVDYDRRGPVDGGDPAPPGDQTFWTVRSEGTSGTVQIDWDYAPGSYVVVLRNTDGSSGVEADTSLELEVPFLHAGLIVALVIGGLLLLLGLVVAIFVARGRPAPPPPPAAAPATPPPPPAAPEQPAPAVPPAEPDADAPPARPAE